jgi:hypothetical protein
VLTCVDNMHGKLQNVVSHLWPSIATSISCICSSLGQFVPSPASSASLCCFDAVLLVQKLQILLIKAIHRYRMQTLNHVYSDENITNLQPN